MEETRRQHLPKGAIRSLDHAELLSRQRWSRIIGMDRQPFLGMDAP